MGIEKTDSKGNGFFNLFDWNKKARKKLFSNGSSSSSEKAEKGKEVDDNMANSVPRLIGEDDMVGISSMKGSSDYSYASSVTDEEGNGLRPPGVVARLMGLDSMPTTGVCEPYSTPLRDSQSLQERRGPEIYINDHLVKGTEAYFRGPVELRSQKMPSSPVERFQTETLPPRSAKTISMTHYKLLSPIRNHTFISGRDAAHIMEVATKILEPGCQTNGTGKGQSFQSLSSPLRIYHSKETARKTSELQESSRRPLELASMRSLRGKPSNKSTNELDYATNFRSLCMDGTDPAVSRGKAKPTVQIRDSTGNNRKALIQKVSDERKLNEPPRSRSNNQKNNNQKRIAMNSSSVLRQNNSKQNYLVSKDKLTSKPIVPKQQGEQIISRDASSGKVRAVSKLPGSARVSYRKDGSGPSNLIKERSRLSTSSNFSRTKKMMEGRISGGREPSDNISVNINEKCIQHNVVVDEQSKWSEDGRKASTEIVSFTFTSSANKSLPGSRFPTHMEVKQDIENGCSLNTCCPNNGIDSDNKKLSTGILNEIDGDYLGVLLEQKLKELTSGDASPYRKSVKGISIACSPPTLQKAASPCETSVTRHTECENRSLRSFKDELIGIFPMNTTLANDHVCRLSHDAQGSERMEYISNSENQKDPERQHLSPLSVFEASFSNESGISSESLESSKGTKISYFGEGIKALDASCFTKVLEVEPETELSDSATSNVVATTVVEPASEISSTYNMDSSKEGLEFVREILNALSISDNISSYKLDQAGEVLDPVLFDELEDNRRLIAFEGEEKDCRMRRKMFFDCVNESLYLKCSHYFQAGYRLWAKGVSVLGKDLAEELYKEMQGWKSIGDWMVDELVDRDMSNHLGRWVDFEIESFEAGVEIERGILSSLVDEVVADILNQVTL
ncbi:uncharacterized protein [Typha angustifolia]|uniref:uncharacterized protein isoform X1 n=1 Tax=Typha angustifolia TaxID=59011 RepID=UPI003C2ADDA7